MVVQRVAIVGGGPAGLVALKSLLEQSTPEHTFEPILFEQEPDIGGTFRWRGYDNAALVSSKQLTSFSDFRMPLSHADHLTLPEYVEYLKAYATHFKLWSYIRLSHRVERIERLSSSPPSHRVHLETTSSSFPHVYSIDVDSLAICTGLHVVPSLPDNIAGLFPTAFGKKSSLPEGTKVFHSSEYKGRHQLKGKRVLVLGSGETGMDVAYEAVKGGAEEVVMCHRDGFLSFPKVLSNFTLLGQSFDGNLPIDGLITNLFETAYVHPWVAASHIRWFISDFVVKRVLWVLTGTTAGCNQWVGELPAERLGRAYVFLNKSAKAQPYINKPYYSRSRLLRLISSYSDPPEDVSDPRSIDLAPWPERIDSNGRVVFRENGRKESDRMRGRVVKPEVVVCCTGYRQEFGFFDEMGGYATPREADVRDLVKRGDESVAFLGFVRPGVGAIPPIAEMQALLWISLLTQHIPAPTSPPHYRLLQKPDARITYGVDHSAYMSQLARDIGADPGLLELYRIFGLKVLFCYAFGAAFPTFYRLVGPYPSATAPRIVKTEIWDIIMRRGLLGNLAMGLIPMIFYGWINALAWVLEKVWIALGPLRKAGGKAARAAGLGWEGRKE